MVATQAKSGRTSRIVSPANKMSSDECNALLAKCRMFSMAIHRKQSDEWGEPVMRHIARVVNYVAELGDPTISALALLHDTLEQSAELERTTSLLGKMLPPGMLIDLRALTWRPLKESYEHHVDRVLVAGQRAVAVKMAELQDQLDQTAHRKTKTLLTLTEQAVFEERQAAYTLLQGVWMRCYA